jgi:predicted RND superfamily exporter protein
LKTLVNVLANAVRKFPWVVVVATVIVTMVLGMGLGGQFLPEEDSNASFAPDAPEFQASTFISQTFGAVTRMQVLTSSTTGDVITLDAFIAGGALDESVRASDASEYLVESGDSPAVLSYLAPVYFAIEGGAPVPTSDAEVKNLYLAGMEQLPPEFRSFLTALVSDDSVEGSATAEFGLTAVSYITSDDFDVSAQRAVTIADAVWAAPTPESITLDPFSQELIFGSSDDFQEEILRLFASAGLIILLVLASVFVVKPGSKTDRTMFYGGIAMLIIGAAVSVGPSLSLLMPDVFPTSWGEAPFGTVILISLAFYAATFLMWSAGSRRLRRTTADTLLTFLTIALAIMWMNGYGFLRFTDQSQMAQILPILLIGLGVDYSIHMTSRYRQELSEGRSVDAAISAAIRTVGIALVLATVTTAVGFLTNVTNDLPALAEFGELAAVGIVFSFLLMLTFVPAVRQLLDRRQERQDADEILPPPFSSRAALARYLTFDGIRTRTEWWAGWGVSLLLAVGSAVLGGISAGIGVAVVTVVLGLVSLVLIVLSIWIYFANAVLRLRDREKSALWLLLLLIPVIGSIWLFVELGFLKGTGQESTGHSVVTAGLETGESRVLPRIIGKTAILPKRFAVVTIVIALVLTAFGAYGRSQLSTEFSFLDFVPTTSPLRETAFTVNDHFEFPETTSVLVTGDVATGSAWNSMLASYNATASVPDVQSVETASGAFPTGTSFMGLMLRFLDSSGEAFDADLSSLAMEAGLTGDFTMSGDADLNAFYDTAVANHPLVMAAVLASEGATYHAALDNFDTVAGESRATELKDGLNEAFTPTATAGLVSVATSGFIISDLIATSLRDSQQSSLALTLGAALLLLVVNFWYESKRPMLGVITTVPVAMVVLWTFGIMAALGIPLGPVTSLISAIGIGIGIPYMIHITHRYLEERIERADENEAIEQTLTHTGGALGGSAMTTAFGFGILMTSTTIPFQQFGFVLAYTIVLALLAAVLVLPSMLVLWDRWHRKRGDVTLDVDVVSTAMFLDD